MLIISQNFTLLRFDSHLEERMKTPVYNKVNKEKVSSCEQRKH